MTRNGSICLAIFGLLTFGATSARAQVSEARLHELLRQAADRVAARQAGQTTGQQGAVPTVAVGLPANRPITRMTLDEALAVHLYFQVAETLEKLNERVLDAAWKIIDRRARKLRLMTT